LEREGDADVLANLDLACLDRGVHRHGAHPDAALSSVAEAHGRAASPFGDADDGAEGDAALLSEDRGALLGSSDGLGPRLGDQGLRVLALEPDAPGMVHAGLNDLAE